MTLNCTEAGLENKLMDGFLEQCKKILKMCLVGWYNVVENNVEELQCIFFHVRFIWNDGTNHKQMLKF